MTPQPAQRSLAFRLFRSVLIALAICLLGFVVLQLIYSDWPRFNVPAEMVSPAWGCSLVLLICIIHVLFVLSARRMIRNSASDIIVIIPLVAFLIVSVAVIAIQVTSNALFGGKTNILETVGMIAILFMPIVFIALLIRPLLAYSIPSNWISVIPLVISYAAIVTLTLMIVGVFKFEWGRFLWSLLGFDWGESRSVWPMVMTAVLIISYYIALGGAIFPTHRALAHLWRPKPLPKLPHRPIPAQEAKL